MVRKQAHGLNRSYKDEEYKEGGDFYDGPAPTVGMHPVKLVDVDDHTSAEGNEGVKWTFDIVEPDKFAGWRGYVYTNDSTTLWKEQEMLVAMGVIQPNATINMSYANILKKAKPARARIINELYEGEATGKIRTLLKADANAPKAKGRAAAEEPDKDFDDDAPLADSDEERDERAEELEALTIVKLKAEAKKAGLTLADYKGKTEDEIIDLILEVEFPEDNEDGDEEDGDEEPEEFDGEALQEELEKLTLVKLKALAKKEYQATVADLKGLDKEDLIEWVLEKAEEAFDEAADADGDDDGQDEQEEAPEPPKRAARSTRARSGRKANADDPPF